MGIKGEVTLKLVDSKSGVTKKSVTLHNMVTKAISNILNENAFREIFHHGILYTTITEPIIKDLLGGIMLFDEALNTSHICPTPEEADHMIGNAGMYTSLNVQDTFNGRLVSAEIGVDTAVFTWSFTEQACVGDIKAVALTNKYGGSIGCKAETIDTTHINNSFITDADAPSAIANRLSPIIALYALCAVNDGLCILDGDTFVKIDTQISSNNRYTSDLSKCNKKEICLNMSRDTFYPFADIDTVAVDSNYVDLQGVMCDSAIQAYAVGTTGELPSYTVKARKYTKDSYTDYDVPMNNLVTAVFNKYTDKGLISEDTPITPEDILSGITAAINNNGVFSHHGKLIWLLGNYSVNAEIQYIGIAVQNLDGSFDIYDVNSADTKFYNMLAGTGKGFYGLLVDKNTTSNNLFETAEIDDDLYLIADYMYLLVNTGEHADLNIGISSRPSLFCTNGEKNVRKADVDTLSVSPYYAVQGVSRWRPSENRTWGLQYGGCVLRTNYFGTIQNLDVPFAKTASDTLQVVYRLTR